MTTNFPTKRVKLVPNRITVSHSQYLNIMYMYHLRPCRQGRVWRVSSPGWGRSLQVSVSEGRLHSRPGSAPYLCVGIHV